MSKVDTTDEELDAAWDAADRAWWLAGWHDSQMEKECIE